MASYDIAFNLIYQGTVRVLANSKKEAEDYVRNGYPHETLRANSEAMCIPTRVTIQFSEKVV